MARWRRLEPGALLGVVLVAHLAFALVTGARALGLLERLELQAYDAGLGWRVAASPPEDRVVVVAITTDDIDADTTVNDATLAAVLARLVAQRPAAIGLDLFRHLPVPPGREELEAVLQDHPEIVVVTGYADAFQPEMPTRAAPSVVTDPERIGFADMPDDPDDAVRRGLLFLTGGDGPEWSLGLRLAERFLAMRGIHPVGDEQGHLRLGAATYPPLGPTDGGYASLPPGGYQFLLTYPACAAPLPTFKVGHVLGGEVPPEAITGRVVLVGNLVRDARDVFQAPVRCAAPERDTLPREIVAPRLFGVELHAQIASQLIREALGEARPLLTPSQALRDPVLGQIAEAGWIWLWTLAGGIALVALPTASALAAGALVLAGALIGSSLVLFMSPGWWLPVVPPLLGLSGAMALGLGYLLGRERRRWAILLDRVSAYVSRRLVDMIAGRRGGPETREVMASVLFSDIRGSAAIAEALPEPELMAWLNEYMSVMADLVLTHGGEIEKFAGDGITANFGAAEAPGGEEQIAADARAAVDCALAMGRELARLNALWRERGLPAIGIRIGIHTGPLMVGNLGSRRRMQYSIIGDTANTAARLEAWGKDDRATKCDPDHCRILISEATFQRLGEGYEIQPVGPLHLKGKRLPIQVFRIVGGPLPAAPPQEERACRV